MLILSENNLERIYSLMTFSNKILILGSTGAVGSAMEKMCPGDMNYVSLGHGDFDFTDAQSLHHVIEKHTPEIIVNCVAAASIDPCEADPETALDLHCVAVCQLARISAEKGVTLIQPSSHAVFDGTKGAPYTETDLPKATGVYAATKLVCERVVQAYCKKFYIVRFPTLFGPRRNNGMGFVDKVVAWIRQGRDLSIADDKIDSPTYSMDAADGIYALCKLAKPYGIYHMANQGWVSYYDFVKKITQILGTKTIIRRAKDADFPSKGYKPLQTGLKSVKLPPLRNYEIALEEYLGTYVQ